MECSFFFFALLSCFFTDASMSSELEVPESDEPSETDEDSVLWKVCGIGGD